MTRQSEDEQKWEAESVALALEAVRASRARMAAGARPPAPDKAMRDAAKQLVNARMVAAEMQPRTVSGRGLEIIATDFKAIITGKDGEEKTADVASKTLALFDKSACAVFRLAHEGMIEPNGALAALVFAAAGDRVLGGFRIRTMEMERIKGGDGHCDIEKDETARWRWNIARLRLHNAQFRILDGVMRHDESAERAARAAYPRVKAKMKLIGMADQALIDACAMLAVEYGFEKRADLRPLNEMRA